MRRQRNQIQGHLCEVCGETNPEKFKTGSKALCLACLSDYHRDRYKAMKGTPIPDASCPCGETDGTKFYPSRKTMCKKCVVRESVKRVKALPKKPKKQRKPHIFSKPTPFMPPVVIADKGQG